jgi:ankyrin repeat protein
MLVLHGYVCVQKDDGWAALHVAAQYGHLECLKELLARGAEVDQACEVFASGLPNPACVQEGWTALHGAAQHGNLECMKELLDRAAVVDQVRSAFLGRGITW